MAIISWTAEVLDQIDTHWQERLRPRLEGLTDDEYFWEPVPDCWSVHRRGESKAPMSLGSGEFTWDYGPETELQPVTTIAWRIGHLLAGADPWHFDFPGTAASALARLDEAHAEFIAEIRSLGDTGLAEPQGDRSPRAFAHAPMARLMLYSSVEVIHHGAEICLLRDLYAKSSA